jgi:hypothetical protein
MEDYGIFESKEKESFRILHEKCSGELEILKRSFGIMIRALLDVYGKLKSEGPRPRNVVLKRLAMIWVSANYIRTSKAAMNLLLNGYPYECCVLLRTMLESINLLRLFFRSKKLVIDWLGGKIIKKALRNIHNIAPEPFDKEFSQMYSVLSNYVHVGRRSLETPVKVTGRDLEKLRDMDEFISIILHPTTSWDDIEGQAMIILLILSNLHFLLFITRMFEKKMERDIVDSIEGFCAEVSSKLEGEWNEVIQRASSMI